MCKNSHSKGEPDDTEFGAKNLPNKLSSSIKIKQPNLQLVIPAFAVRYRTQLIVISLRYSPSDTLNKPLILQNKEICHQIQRTLSCVS